jgi:hypothetical protein
MRYIPIGHELMELIDGYEMADNPTLSGKSKKEIELLLEIELIDWIESYEIKDMIKHISVSIDWGD